MMTRQQQVNLLCEATVWLAERALADQSNTEKMAKVLKHAANVIKFMKDEVNGEGEDHVPSV